jgi:hypothetical protein
VLDLTIALADGFSPPPPVDALDVNSLEGKAEKAAGKVQNTVGGVKDSLRGK